MNFAVENIRTKQIKTITPHALETIHPRYEHVPNFYQRVRLDPSDYRNSQNPDDVRWLDKLHAANQKATLVAEFEQKCAQSQAGGSAWYALRDPVDENNKTHCKTQNEVARELKEHNRKVAEVMNEKHLLEAKRKRLAGDPLVREMKAILSVLDQRRAMEASAKQKALNKEQEGMVIALDRMQDAVDDLDWFQRASDAECIRRLAGKERSGCYRQEIEDKRTNAAREKQNAIEEESLQLERLRVQTLIDQQREAERMRKKARDAQNERDEFVALHAAEKEKQRVAEALEDERIRQHQTVLLDREEAVKRRQFERAELTRQCFENLKAVVEEKQARQDEFEQLQQELVSHEKAVIERVRREAARDKKIRTRVELNEYYDYDWNVKAQVKAEEKERDMQYVLETITHNELADEREAKVRAARLEAQAGSIAVQKRNEALRQTLHDDEQRREKETEQNLQRFRDTNMAEIAEERLRLLREAVDKYGGQLVSCVRNHLQPNERDYLTQINHGSRLQTQNQPTLCTAH